jgi:hypothetical protein
VEDQLIAHDAEQDERDAERQKEAQSERTALLIQPVRPQQPQAIEPTNRLGSDAERDGSWLTHTVAIDEPPASMRVFDSQSRALQSPAGRTRATVKAARVWFPLPPTRFSGW